ncbi:unnamed protein product [Urochloa humidicola]
MASTQLVAVAVVLAALVGSAQCGPPKVPPGKNISATCDGKWLDAKATWYGKAKGAGPDDNGGACGYKDVNKAPFNSMVRVATPPFLRTAWAAVPATRSSATSRPSAPASP